jgi:hypothetical protein
MLRAVVFGLAAALAVAAIMPANAENEYLEAGIGQSMIVPVSGGCGPYAWRGPWGHCRDTPYYGRLPHGGWKSRPSTWNGCPPGHWRGPYGHCRDTPFHGRLPNGQWT